MSPITRYAGQLGGRFVSGFVMAVGVFLAGLWIGFRLGGVSPRIELAQQRETASRTLSALADHANRTLREAQTRGDALTTQLHAANRAAALTQEKLDDALRHATTGSTCLREPALRLLDGAHGIRVELPAAAGSTPAADGPAAAAAGEPVSSDTDVARWIAGAGLQYDECRRRLDALIGWHAEPAP